MERNKAKTSGFSGPEACVHCHLCRKHCGFLKKYQIDIGDTDKLRSLSYHCFLCGTCTSVCPKGIDGRQIILNMRRAHVAESGKKPEGYRTLLWEKDPYKFRNYRKSSGKSVFFPGCNFPSFYPRTNAFLTRFLQEEAGIGVIYDCCGKPVAELGMEEREKESIRELEKRLSREGVEELIVVCPNCYHFLKGRIGIRVVSIYQKLEELGGGKKSRWMKVKNKGVPIFLPCPDRREKEILEDIKPFLEAEPLIRRDVQCCGLGGCGARKEPEIAAHMTDPLKNEELVYTYCASCCGNLARKGIRVRHVLVEILGTKEEPDTKKSLINRAKLIF